MPPRNGYIKGVTIDPSVEGNIIDQFMWWKKGDCVENFLTHKLGIVFLKFDTMEEMIEKTERMHELIKVEMS